MFRILTTLIKLKTSHVFMCPFHYCYFYSFLMTNSLSPLLHFKPFVFACPCHVTKFLLSSTQKKAQTFSSYLHISCYQKTPQLSVANFTHRLNYNEEGLRTVQNSSKLQNYFFISLFALHLLYLLRKQLPTSPLPG